VEPERATLGFGFQVLFTYAPPMQLLFESSALAWPEWLWMALAALTVFALVELEKAWQRRRASSRVSRVAESSG